MKNFTEFLEYVTETVGSGGIAYEKKVRVVVDKIEKNFSNFKRMASKGGDFGKVLFSSATGLVKNPLLVIAVGRTKPE